MSNEDNSIDLTDQNADMKAGVKLGLRMAADFVGQFDKTSCHRFKLGDCVLQKFGLIDKTDMRFNRDKNVTMIVQVVAQETGAPVMSIMSRSRLSLIVRARHLCIWLASKILELNSYEIGNEFKLHHTSVLHAIRCGRRKYDNGSKLWREMVNKIIKEIEG